MSLDIKKNRYDGVVGRIELDFNPVNLCYFERNSSAAPSSNGSKSTIASSKSTVSASNAATKAPAPSVAAARSKLSPAVATSVTTPTTAATVTDVTPAPPAASSSEVVSDSLPRYRRNRAS